MCLLNGVMISELDIFKYVQPSEPVPHLSFFHSLLPTVRSELLLTNGLSDIGIHSRYHQQLVTVPVHPTLSTMAVDVRGDAVVVGIWMICEVKNTSLFPVSQ